MIRAQVLAYFLAQSISAGRDSSKKNKLHYFDGWLMLGNNKISASINSIDTLAAGL